MISIALCPLWIQSLTQALFFVFHFEIPFNTQRDVDAVGNWKVAAQCLWFCARLEIEILRIEIICSEKTR